MRKIIDLTGKKFNNLIVINIIDKRTKSGQIMWKCLCDCGNITNVRGGSLKNGSIRSCGCFKKNYLSKKMKNNKFRLKHGMFILNNGKKSLTYTSWDCMIQRCTNTNNTYYHRYGGRGIKVCDRWLNSFENFLEDMGERPENKTIDRIDNNGNYEPSNCRWATRKEQRNNQG